MSPAVEARRLLRHCRSGALATLSARLGGHPFASIVPFMSDFDASPVLLVSRLAEHTKNIAFDARVSLMVHEPNADVQAAARLTIAGLCTRIDAPGGLRERYLRFFPAAAELLALDFEFHRIAPSAIRYIGGFGKIHWLSTETFCASGGIDGDLEHSGLAALNGAPDPVAVNDARAIALDCDGVDFRRDDTLHRVDFAEPVTHPAELSSALQGLPKQWRD